MPPDELNTEKPRLRALRRCAAEELQLLALLSPIACSNLAVPFSKEIYATDASNSGGGMPMLRKTQALLASHDLDFEGTGHDYGTATVPDGVPRPLGLHFEFLEVCGGSGVVTKALIRRGVCCGPVLDLSFSKQFDLKEKRVVQWVVFMLESDRLQSVMIAPPCTTFSPAAFPSLRSYVEPRGYNQQDPVFGMETAWPSLCW